MKKTCVNRIILSSILLAFLAGTAVTLAGQQTDGCRSAALAPKTIFADKDLTPLVKKAQADVIGRRIMKRGGEGIPVRRTSAAAGIDLQTADVVTGTVNNKGELVIEKEYVEKFWDEKKRNLVLKLFRLLKRSTSQAHREFLKEVRFRIVDNSENLMRIYRDDEGVYEIIVDRTLFDLKDVDIYPFMALALNHEFNHPQLHAELSGKSYDPLVVEMSALLANLDMYAGMRASREKVKQVLRMLPAHGFDAGPFAEFLEAGGLGAKERVAAAYELATHRR